MAGFGDISAGTYAGGAAALGGLALSAFGTYGQVSASKKEAQASQQITGLEQQAEAQRMQAMTLAANRQSMEQLRQNQRARSMALNNATNQGAQFGSGLQGGYGQIGGQTGTNLLGINQNLQIGQNIFGINSQISQQKIAMSQAKSDEATSSGIASFGKSALSSIEPIAKLGAQVAPLLLGA